MSMELGVMLALVAMVGYGFSDLFLTKAARRSGEYPTLFWRGIIILLLTLPVVLAVEGTILIPLEHLWLLLLLGVIGTLAYYSYSKAVKVGVVSVISPFSHSAVLLTILLAFIFLGERLNMLQSLAVGLIILGMVFISVDYKELKKMRVKHLTRGMGYAVITFFGWGLYSFLNKIAIDRIGPFLTLFYFEVVSLAALLIVLPWSSGVKIDKVGMKFVIWLAIVITVADIAANIAISMSLLSVVIPIIYSATLVTLVLAAVFLNEKIGRIQKISALAIILGIILVSI